MTHCEKLERIRAELGAFMSEKRLSHVLGVEREAIALAELFSRFPGFLSPEDAERLQIAALLHDVTKERAPQEQLQLCDSHGIALSAYERLTPKLLHARTGGIVAKEHFGEEIVNGVIIDAIRWHTTGRADMTPLQALLYLADWIEPTRTWESCLSLRAYFYAPLEKIHSAEELRVHLDRTLLYSYDLIIRDLLEDGKTIDENTVAARNSLIVRLAAE